MMTQQVYTYEEAYGESLKYFNNVDLPAKIFVDKYALRDNDGNLLEKTPTDMHRRLSKEFARIESKKFNKPYTEDEIFGWFDKFKCIIPQGSPLSGIGNDRQYVSLSNCTVAEAPLDSYSSILDTDQQLVNLSKRRCGVGISLDNLRPTDSPTKNSARTSTGVKTWMERYSNSTREVGQNSRRGALMLTLNVHHPDIERFITAKNDNTSVTGANISTKLTDEFMFAVNKDEDYEQRFPVNTDCPTISKMVSAKKIWDMIIHNAWERAEPGILMWDNILKESPADCYALLGFETICTNPCSEIPLSALDSCRLMALNLFCCVKNPFKKNASFDWKLLSKFAGRLQRLMDDLVDLELECIDRIINKIKADPEPEDAKRSELELWMKLRRNCQNGRRTGSGITALGDTMAALGIKYGSDESIEFTQEVYKHLKLGAYQSSVDMAEEIGAFPIWDAKLEKTNPFLLRIKDEDPALYNKMQKVGRRNIALLTTAPTGTISQLACMTVDSKEYFGTTSGVEPNYTWKPYKRRKKGNPGDTNFRADFVDQSGDSWMEFRVYPAGVSAWMAVNDIEDLIDATDDNCPYLGASAEEINWEKRVELQAVAQKHIDHAISSTINLPSDVKEEEVARIYMKAWELGLKGVTIYRDGCRTGVLVKYEPKVAKIPKTDCPKRPKKMPCEIHHTTIKGQSYLVVVGLLDGEPYEVFASENGTIDKKFKEGYVTKQKRGHYQLISGDHVVVNSLTVNYNEYEEAMTRMVSTSLRHGANISFVVHQLEKSHGDIQSFNKAIARILKKYIPDGTKVSGESCEQCGADLQRKEGCVSCPSCGWSKC